MYREGGNNIKYFAAIILSSVIYIFSPYAVHAEDQSIQSRIDAAEAGETIQLSKGVYEENIIIHKPVHLKGEEGAVLIQKGNQPLITVEANDAVIEDIQLENNAEAADAPAVHINGDNNTLENISINTNSYGIQLKEANKNYLSNIHIQGTEGKPIEGRQHGIDLWKSDKNEIRLSHISFVKDGIYIEKSHHNNIYENTVFQSRYGYHLMFTKNTSLVENESYENVSGMMVMGADKTVIEKNVLKDNQANVQSLGLLLFDTVNATITNNEISRNRIGIFIEMASENDLAFNHVQGNYIGLQFKGAEQNHISRNAFVGNVVQGQAKESSNNDTNHNYWSDHLGLDMTGDETSNLTYEVDPFFLQVTNQYPPMQLLFQSPGMNFLDQLMDKPEDEKLIDRAPLMQNPLHLGGDLPVRQASILFLCLGLLTFSTITIYMGVRR